MSVGPQASTVLKDACFICLRQCRCLSSSLQHTDAIVTTATTLPQERNQEYLNLLHTNRQPIFEALSYAGTAVELGLIGIIGMMSRASEDMICP